METTASKAPFIADEPHPLDNPIWSALATSQAHLAEAGRLARRFPKHLTVLGALLTPTVEAWDDLAHLPSAPRVTALFLNTPPEPSVCWELIEKGRGLQMIYSGDKQLFASGSCRPREITELGAADAPEMKALV